jgi:alanine-glyoxylate transaminase/serine-glyoxylate transaminase/serine-pyruvate transaminase
MGLDWRPADPAAVDRCLERERNVEVVTLMRCGTPSALYNPLRELAKEAADHGVLLIVDAASSVGADEILFDQWRVGVLIVGSQKALNAPPDSTILAVSKAALDRAGEVGREIFYMNYFLWEEWLEKGGFPYTIALKEGLDKILEGSVFQRHKAARLTARRAVEALGLKPYPQTLECTCPTVTAFKTPIPATQLGRHIWEKYGVLLAGSWGPLEGEVMRIGHMGVQASLDHLATLGAGLKDFDIYADVEKAVDAVVEAFRSWRG